MAVTTVGAGKTHATLALWLASLPATLTEIEEAVCTGAVGPFVKTTGITATASAYLKVTGDSNGIAWDDANATAKNTSGSNNCTIPYTKTVGMQFDRTITASSQQIFSMVVAAGTYALIDRCIARPTGGVGSYTSVKGFGTGAGPTHIVRSTAIGLTGTNAVGFYFAGINTETVYALSLTAHNCNYGIQRASSSNNLIAKNCLAQSCTDGFIGTFYTGSTNNCSSIASDAPGSDPVTGTVVFEDDGLLDFHLDSTDTVATGAGADLTSDYTALGLDIVDGDGQSITAWSIGADVQAGFVSSGITISMDTAWAMQKTNGVESAWACQGVINKDTAWAIQKTDDADAAWAIQKTTSADAAWAFVTPQTATLDSAWDIDSPIEPARTPVPAGLERNRNSLFSTTERVEDGNVFDRRDN